jgi:hypothetical protein
MFWDYQDEGAKTNGRPKLANNGGPAAVRREAARRDAKQGAAYPIKPHDDEPFAGVPMSPDFEVPDISAPSFRSWWPSHRYCLVPGEDLLVRKSG